MRVENRHYHFQTAVRLDMRRKIHLSANSKLRLFLIKFRYVKRRFLVKNNLRTTDRKGQDAERLIAFQRPIVAHIGHYGIEVVASPGSSLEAAISTFIGVRIICPQIVLRSTVQSGNGGCGAFKGQRTDIEYSVFLHCIKRFKGKVLHLRRCRKY